ncbi:hypothetical protein AUEXF2481DRAFT_317470 [Aureobasidium subglaciale EXF-2481]|uniref:DNA/RNA-binding domain-containing protein n=1 Tax=Aureobasidium subglaciale (strain EXF-2481) TaxID=1043005 RepID=A0A074Y821_AURSE|nr:uncharacterized protein AUEXF2481DRAFT_317470 [Aureobasidium subglaciale EXF-2481]KEQ93933.1 hypothetical protein AUEXF2481DRAFT_317470 [Aureobasidium subglaciale EXF-2481]
MEPTGDQALAKANALEQEFTHTLQAAESALDTVFLVLQQYRAAAAHALATDFMSARAGDVEVRLWNAHNRLNVRLRKQLSKLRKDRSSKPVETRKFIKTYLEFLKDSQRFYRDYIQKLNARFGGIQDLERIARRVRSDPVPKSSKRPLSSHVQAAVILSCHQTLIYLGDLFRYRAAERLDKEPDWGPAIGYYALAASLRPDSGLAFHQQSVVAFEQGDYLRSTYYLYRSINVVEPHPNAIPNLELQFKKITTGWQKGDLVPKHSPKDQVASRKALLSWFIRFHSLSYNGQLFPGYDELEREVLSRTITEIKGRTLDGVLSKMSLINFCAQATAGNQFESKPDQHKFMQSYFFFLRLNVKFFTAILQTYHDDLGEHIQEHTTTSDLTDRITDVARHVLPALRLYSTWLLSNAHIVTARVGDGPIQEAMDRFWHVYARTLSAVASSFSFRELSEVPYQLEEDVNAYGLRPLNSDRSCKVWLHVATGESKAKYDDEGVTRLKIDEEMLGRIRELLFDALLLAVDKDVPITFDGSQFIPQDGQLIDSAADVVLVHDTATVIAQQETAATKRTPQAPVSSGPTNTSSKQLNREAQLSRMVDDLVGPDEDDDLVPAALGQDSLGITGHNNITSLRGISPCTLQGVRTPDTRTEAWQLPLSPTGPPAQRLYSVSNIWNDTPAREISPITPYGSAPPGLPARTSNAHSRVNSTSSVRSPLQHLDGLSSFEPTPNLNNNVSRGDRYHSFSGHYAGMQSPLLFGAGTSPWSTGPRKSVPNVTPPNGQGG